jgi:hypothetical protein
MRSKAKIGAFSDKDLLHRDNIVLWVQEYAEVVTQSEWVIRLEVWVAEQVR